MKDSKGESKPELDMKAKQSLNMRLEWAGREFGRRRRIGSGLIIV